MSAHMMAARLGKKLNLYKYAHLPSLLYFYARRPKSRGLFNVARQLFIVNKLTMKIGDRILYKTPAGNIYDAIVQDMTPDGQYVEIHTDWQHIKDLNVLTIFPYVSMWQRIKTKLKYLSFTE